MFFLRLKIDGTGLWMVVEILVFPLLMILLIKSYLKVDPPTRWVNLAPIKVNVFSWRLRLDKLPVMVNLEKRGRHIHSLLCPLCDDGVELANLSTPTLINFED